MANRKIAPVKNHPKRRLKGGRSQPKAGGPQLPPPQLSPAEQLEAERFKGFTQQRAARQAKVQELAETFE